MEASVSPSTSKSPAVAASANRLEPFAGVYRRKSPVRVADARSRRRERSARPPVRVDEERRHVRPAAPGHRLMVKSRRAKVLVDRAAETRRWSGVRGRDPSYETVAAERRYLYMGRWPRRTTTVPTGSRQYSKRAHGTGSGSDPGRVRGQVPIRGVRRAEQRVAAKQPPTTYAECPAPRRVASNSADRRPQSAGAGAATLPRALRPRDQWPRKR